MSLDETTPDLAAVTPHRPHPDAASMPYEAAYEALEQPIPADLLVALHNAAVALLQAESPLLRSWAHHLMEDWRSLELLAERYRR